MSHPIQPHHHDAGHNLELDGEVGGDVADVGDDERSSAVRP